GVVTSSRRSRSPVLCSAGGRASGPSHGPKTGTGRWDALRVSAEHDRRLLDEGHARPTDDRLLRFVRSPRSQARDDAVPPRPLPRVPAGAPVSLRARAARVRSAPRAPPRPAGRATPARPAGELAVEHRELGSSGIGVSALSLGSGRAFERIPGAGGRAG